MHLCLFEDSHSLNFLPLTYFRPVYDLRCGMMTLRQRIQLHLRGKQISLYCREYLARLVEEGNPSTEINRISGDACLLINGRCVMSPELAKLMLRQKSDTLFVSRGEIVGARLSGGNLARLRSHLSPDAVELSEITNLPSMDVHAVMVRYPWELIHVHDDIFNSDFESLTSGGKRPTRSGKIHKSAILVGQQSISIGKGTRVGPGVVLDATEGPIYIGRDVNMMAHSVIEGPCSIADRSVIKVGAKIYGRTAIGPLCKVGGEVEHSIFHSHANKQHDGFVGHSYLGKWVNLGAGTTTSNLKNTYGNIRVTHGEQRIDTGVIFLGTIAGDHVKVGINGTLGTGTVIGPSTNLVGSEIPPAYTPPFSWWTQGNVSQYDLDKALDVAIRVMLRRNVETSDAYKEVFRTVFTMTKHERTRH